jgi:hypothetical protein
MSSLVEQFSKWNYKNTKPLSLNGNTYFGKCVKVYDGDTCWIAGFFNGTDRDPERISIRCLGYDSPEIKPKEGTKEEKEREKESAKECKEVLSKLILDKIVKITIGDPNDLNKNDKYGRYLGTIHVHHTGKVDDEKIPITDDCEEDSEDLLNVNEYMLKYTSSVAYDGGKKELFSERCSERCSEQGEDRPQKTSEPPTTEKQQVHVTKKRKKTSD